VITGRRILEAGNFAFILAWINLNPMLRAKLVLFSFITISFFSCIGRQAYYVSPFNGINTPYHSVPMRGDSIKSASYFNASITAGGANEGENDPKYSLTADFSRSHNFGIFQAYYAGGLTVGSYRMKPYDSVGNNYTVNYRIINHNRGTYFFGGGGFDGGINIVTGSKDFEWRIFGLETSLRQEFGEFAKVRERIPDSAVTVVIRNRFFGTLGMFTEIVDRGRNGSTGFKLGWGKVIGDDYNNFSFKDSYFGDNPPRFGYFIFDVHTTRDKFTYYLQANLAKKAGAFIFGMNYKISK
jgi:hypothetical protein